jgi:alpha-L-fucosidase
MLCYVHPLVLLPFLFIYSRSRVVHSLHRCRYSDFCNASYGGFAHPISDHPWAYWATTCPQGSWGFSDAETSDDYQTADYFVKLLVATVSEGGVLLLNLGPTHRGTIAAIQQRILEGIGDWLAVNGEAIYSTVALPKGSRAEDLVEMSTFMPAQVGWNNVFGVKPGTPEKGILYLGKV